MINLRRLLHNAVEAITQAEAFSLTQPLGDIAQKLNGIVDARLAAPPVPPPLRLPAGVGDVPCDVPGCGRVYGDCPHERGQWRRDTALLAELEGRSPRGGN